MAVFATRDKIQNKMADRGNLCMFLGYSDEHDDSTYRMMNISNKRVIHTRDITWLQKTYGEYYQVQKPMIVEMEDDESTGNNILNEEESTPEEIISTDIPSTMQTLRKNT